MFKLSTCLIGIICSRTHTGFQTIGIHQNSYEQMGKRINQVIFRIYIGKQITIINMIVIII